MADPPTNEETWQSCCRGRKCAHFKVEGEEVLIRDDFGGEVRLNPDELNGFVDQMVERRDADQAV